MSFSFEFASAVRLVFGPGVKEQAVAALAAWGVRSVLIVTGRDAARAAPFTTDLTAHGIAAVAFAVAGEPTVELARAGVRAAREAGAEGVIAVGGGSVLDAGKAIAALATNGGEPLDFLEVVGAGKALAQPALPFVAVPTTAGTGAEVTRNAVLAVPEARVKASLRSPLMLPRLAVVDPDLLAPLPRATIASGGLDALSQVIEPFVSVRANPLSDALAREGIRRSAGALGRAYVNGLANDAAARADLAIASVCGGLCLANAGLGAVHGFAAPAGGMLGAPHGAICAALLPHVMTVNLRALRARAPEHPALRRLREVAALLTAEAPEDVAAEDGITFVSALCATLNIPGLTSYGLGATDIPALVERAKAASSMRGNPLPLSDTELTEIVERAL